MSEENVQCYEFGDFQLDLVNYRLMENGEPVPLTQKSFELLHYLIENHGRVLKKDELLDALWEGSFVEEANLTQHVYMLRKALRQKGGEGEYIETIPKTGYRFVAEVRTIECVYEREESEPFDPEFTNDRAELAGGGRRDLRRSSVQLPARMRRRNVIAAGSLVVVCAFLVAGVIYFRSDANVRDDEGPVAAIAVLPFKQISEVKDEKLGLGIADVIIAKLANMENLAVRPTTSIVRFADERSDDLFEIGRKLNVEYVIEGSIQRENGTVRVTTQLYSVSQKKQVWTETFDEEYIDIFALQDSISEKVAQKVAIGLDSKRREFPIKQYTRDADAYQAYSTGLSYWSQHSKIGFESAIPHFELAIERDPHFPLPYAYLADTYGHFAYLQSTITREKALRLGEEMANKALKLDPECAEAMSAKALVLSYRKRGEEAFTLMQRSLKIKPNDSHARHRLAWMYANRGDLETALKEMDKAVELDPQSVYLNVYMANLQYLARKGKESLEFCDKALAVDPDSSAARWRKLHALELLGKYKEIEKELEGSLAHTRNPRALRLFLARVLAESRQMDRARAIYRTTSGNKGNDDNGLLDVGALAALGDNEKALKSLEATVIKHDPDLFIIRFEPILDPIRNDPRYQALVRDLAISEGWNADS